MDNRCFGVLLATRYQLPVGVDCQRAYFSPVEVIDPLLVLFVLCYVSPISQDAEPISSIEEFLGAAEMGLVDRLQDILIELQILPHTFLFRFQVILRK